jgi:hypothetical protein
MDRTKHLMGNHAKNFPPSSGHRWLLCGQSVGGPQGGPSTDAAELGTAAHELFEVSMKEGKHPRTYEGRHFNIAYVADDAMIDAVEIAWEKLHPELNEKMPYGIEHEVLIPATGETGTVDHWRFDHKTGTLYVWDYKNGRHKVEAKDNMQMRLYALGIIARISKMFNEPIKIVQIGIIQPNAQGDSVSIYGYTLAQLMTWGREKVAPQVALIKSGKAPYKAGMHCTFCWKAPTCKALAKHVAAQTKTNWDIK